MSKLARGLDLERDEGTEAGRIMGREKDVHGRDDEWRVKEEEPSLTSWLMGRIITWNVVA